MKVVCISDLHGKLPPVIPNCDLLLISGDICPHSPMRTYAGSLDDMLFQGQWLNTTFREWLEKTPAKNVIACWGNHDYVAERKPNLLPTLPWTLLTDSWIEHEGLKIWATPYSLWFHDWAFNSPPKEEGGEEFLARKYAGIPEDCDIILSHGPPLGIGDRTLEGDRTGSSALVAAIKRIGPQLVVCGHIHEGYGTYEIETDKGTTVIVNASVLDRSYFLVNQPIVLEIGIRNPEETV